MRVLTWNLFHGRSVPETRRGLLAEFTDMLVGWDWDVALLQEVPPWWPRPLGAACGADVSRVLTSRNAGLAARRAVAARRPDLLKANGGGANAILVRGGGAPGREAARRVRWWPERRVVHAVAVGAVWVGNVHASTEPRRRAPQDVARAGAAVAAWAGGAPALLGGDMNVADAPIPGWTDLGGHSIDRFYGRDGIAAAAPPRTLDRGSLSDHAPVLIEVAA